MSKRNRLVRRSIASSSSVSRSKSSVPRPASLSARGDEVIARTEPATSAPVREQHHAARPGRKGQAAVQHHLAGMDSSFDLCHGEVWDSNTRALFSRSGISESKVCGKYTLLPRAKDAGERKGSGSTSVPACTRRRPAGGRTPTLLMTLVSEIEIFLLASSSGWVPTP